MCGIFALLNNNDQVQDIIPTFELGSRRGPDKSSIFKEDDTSIMFGFHRLAINGLDAKSDQPLDLEGCTLICNGEIYNYKQLYETFDITPVTNSDCEVIIHLYKKFGMYKTIQMIDGVFAFCLYDNVNNKCYVGRDPYGVRSLYKRTNYSSICFSSTLDSIVGIFKHSQYKTSQFSPGTLEEYNYDGVAWYFIKSYRYHNVETICSNTVDSITHACHLINTALERAVKKRVYNCDRDIACLLSGGLDSSLITSLVSKYYTEKTGRRVKTFSIGMEGSDDLRHAQIVADFLNTEHTEICVSEKDFLNVIGEVIYMIESYDTTTVRASVGNYLVAKYISEHCDAKVIFNGDGSDEVCGGYMYFHCAPNHIEFDQECKRLLKDIHYYDVLRSDRTISSNGLEARTPFLDKEFVNLYLSISSELRFETNKKIEKYLLRKAFDDDKTLPKEVLWRRKEAFSDGVSKQTRSWYEIIQDYVDEIIQLDHDNEFKDEYNPPTTKEQLYYRMIFDKNYKDCGNLIPYFWMPRFVEASDASARTLDIYKTKMKTEN